MDVEPTAGPVGPEKLWVPVHRWLALLAGLSGGLLILIVILNFALTPVYLALAPSQRQAFSDAVGLVGPVLWWTLVAISCAVAVLLVQCWKQEVRPGRRALVLIGAGLIATWSWYLLDRWLNVWGLRSLTDSTAELAQLITMATIVNQVVDVVSAGLLITGAVLLGSVRPTPEAGNH